MNLQSFTIIKRKYEEDEVENKQRMLPKNNLVFQLDKKKKKKQVIELGYIMPAGD